MTGTKRKRLLPAVKSGRRCPSRLCAAALVLLLASASGFPQANSPGGADDSAGQEPETSKRVDESEESYRTRMELRDQRYREPKRADTIYSNQGGTSKMDQLPDASREHIKEQLREMIMASRQWKPGEDVSDYPYEPSAAAQTDAQLRSQEREAWAEQLQKYQQREAAAYATANQGKQAGGQQSGQGSEGSGKQGSTGSTGSNSGSAGQNRPDSARDSEAYEDREKQMEQVSTAGVSESALSFLQGKAGDAGQQDMQNGAAANGKTSSPAAGDAPAVGSTPQDKNSPGSLSVKELAALQGMDTDAGGASGSSSEKPQTASAAVSGARQGPDGRASSEDRASVNQTEALAGTMAIDDLRNIQGTVLQNSGSVMAGSGAGEEAGSSETSSTEPGTLEIEELRRLDGP